MDIFLLFVAFTLVQLVLLATQMYSLIPKELIKHFIDDVKIHESNAHPWLSFIVTNSITLLSAGALVAAFDLSFTISLIVCLAAESFYIVLIQFPIVVKKYYVRQQYRADAIQLAA